MTNPHLHGNNRTCRHCQGSGNGPKLIILEHALGGSYPPLAFFTRPKPCKACKGTGRQPKPASRIIAETIAAARRHHWPQFNKRNPHA